MIILSENTENYKKVNGKLYSLCLLSSCTGWQYIIRYIFKLVYFCCHMDKCAIFIDGGYFSKILKKKFNSSKIDYLKFSNNISKGYDRIRTYYYNCRPYKASPPTDDEKERFDSMNIFSHFSIIPKI